MYVKQASLIFLSALFLSTAVSNASVPQENPSFSIEDVRAIQIELRNRGYDPGQINGMMSSETQAAIRAFQNANNLPATGVLDDATKQALGVPAPHKQDSRDVTERISEAASILHALVTAGDKRVPVELLQQAEAVAVIPNVLKGAIGVGGRYGKGVISQRPPGGRWSPPVFIGIGGGSFGPQIGVSSTDLVLIFTSAEALSTMGRGAELKLGIDAAIVAGPVGRTAEAGVDIGMDSAIYAYSRSKGLFAGIALDGAVLKVDDGLNRQVYGEQVTAHDILNGNVTASATVRLFIDALEKVVPKHKISETR